MKVFLRIVLGVVAVILLLVVVVFGMRFYNTQKYNLSEEQEAFDYHDVSNYPDSFEGGTVEHFESGMANGLHLLPDNPNDTEPIVVFGGSEGSSNFQLAEQIAEEGYEVYSLFFFLVPIIKLKL